MTLRSADLGRDRDPVRSPLQDVAARALGDGENLVDELSLHTEGAEGAAEVLEDGVEVRVVESREVGVAVAEVFAGVVDGTPEDHGEEGALLALLARHVDAGEEVADAVVGEDALVEQIDGGIDGPLAAELLVEGLIRHGVRCSLRGDASMLRAIRPRVNS